MAITRSYTKPCIKIYEVKVSRSDFKGDGKWNLYLQYCNEFYFVCPAGMITKEELPLDVGLIWYYPDKDKVITKRKAVRRDITADLSDMYRYILYSVIKPDRIPFYSDKREFARAYIEDRANRKDVGYALGSKLAFRLQEAEAELERLSQSREKLDFLDKLMELMDDKGIVPSYLWPSPYRQHTQAEYDHLLKMIEGKLGRTVPDEIYTAVDQLKRITTILERAASAKDSTE